MKRSGRILVVNQRHPKAGDKNPGTEKKPFRTINAAAQLAQPGDTVLVHAGVYRERVSPARGGEKGRPIIYAAAPGETVALRGSELFRPAWTAVKGAPKGVWRGSLAKVKFGAAAYRGVCDPRLYGDFNPYLVNFDRNTIARPHAAVIASLREIIEKARNDLALLDPHKDPVNVESLQRRLERLEKDADRFTRRKDPCYRTTLGQVFVDGLPLVEVERMSELYGIPGAWMVSPEGDALLVHEPTSEIPLAKRLVEISVRHTVFAPLTRGLGYIHVKGFTIEHGANHSPTWGNTGWPQSGLLSTRTGHHWVIENNLIRYAKSVGIDCGGEHIDSDKIEHPGEIFDARKTIWEAYQAGRPIPQTSPGRHIIRNNRVCDNGHCGITGNGQYQTQVLGNVIERNNRTGYTSPWWEFGGIKFHFFFDGLIEGNLIRDNDAHGIWLDNQWRGSRVTRNVIINNLWSGINMELGRGPALIDNNVIAYTRQGDGIYGHDMADFTIAHNLIYANANCGIWVAYCTPRVKPQDGCWDVKTFNNMILGNKAAAIGYPLPWECAGNNVSDGNLLMGGGEYLDEGSRPFKPLFILTNKTHCGQFPDVVKVQFPMTVENTVKLFAESLDKAKVPAEKRPNLATWADTYYVDLDVWRAIFGNDANSRVTFSIRDGLQSRLVAWEFDLDETIREVVCAPVPGVDKDFSGNPMPKSKPLPGPFQDIEIDARNHITLWPVRGVPCSWVLE